jgi:hypothetical protein
MNIGQFGQFDRYGLPFQASLAGRGKAKIFEYYTEL